MSDEVYLKNLTRRTHVIVLSHAAFRDKRYGFKVTHVLGVDTDRDGNSTRREVRRALPGSLTLLPMSSSEPLHPAIAKEPQVAALLAARAVAILPYTAPEAPQETVAHETLHSGTSRRVRVAKRQEDSDVR